MDEELAPKGPGDDGYKFAWQHEFLSAGIGKVKVPKVDPAKVIAVGMALSVRAHHRHGDRVWVTQETLSEGLGLSADAVKRAMRWLRSEGWITEVAKADPRNGRGAHYRLTIPAEQRASGCPVQQRASECPVLENDGEEQRASGCPVLDDQQGAPEVQQRAREAQQGAPGCPVNRHSITDTPNNQSSPPARRSVWEKARLEVEAREANKIPSQAEEESNLSPEDELMLEAEALLNDEGEADPLAV